MTAPTIHAIKLKPRPGVGPIRRLEHRKRITILADLMRSETERGFQPKGRGR